MKVESYAAVHQLVSTVILQELNLEPRTLNL
jgi:hypothetical protein